MRPKVLVSVEAVDDEALEDLVEGELEVLNCRPRAASAAVSPSRGSPTTSCLGGPKLLLGRRAEHLLEVLGRLAGLPGECASSTITA